MARAYIGTSGFSYDHWRDDFYAGVPRKDWFRHYRQNFRTVELNATFYRLPRASTFERWASEMPEDYALVLKGSRYLTHVKRLLEPEEPLKRFFDLARPLGGRLHAVLWQLPPSARAEPERLRLVLEALEQWAPGVRQAFEFRHPSWFTQDVFDLLSFANAAGVVADAPFQAIPPGEAPRRDDQPLVRVPETADFAYVRRHGPWQAYGGTYPDDAIEADAARVRRWVEEGRDVYVYYNNDVGGHAVRDAQRLTRSVGDAAVLPPTVQQRLQTH